MVRFLLLLLLPVTLLAQSGRYHIKAINALAHERGYVVLTPVSIRVCENDTTEVEYKVVNVTELNGVTYYVLEGEGFRGAGIFQKQGTDRIGRGYVRYYFSLYIEIRERRKYLAKRYFIFYEK